jgi:hypothetical protein
MKKLPVYEMLIDEDMESDLQVDWVALVDRPAIKKDFVKFNDQFVEPAKGERETEFMPRCISYVVNEGKSSEQAVAICSSMWQQHFAEESWNDYPEAAVENAKTALRWVEENGWGDCGEATGKIRANQLANREKLTRETIARMSAFQRHKQNSDRPLGEGCGRLMWLCWGGDEGIAWAERKLAQIDRKGFAIQDEDKRIISGPLMIANQRIFRTDPELGEYEVFFSPETIKKIAIKMAKKGFHNNVNLMHNADMKVSGVTLFEVFQSDKSRGIRAMKGFEDLADGTLFGSMYVENPVAWQMIKDGFIKGFSVEGNFGMKKKDEYLEQFEKIVDILNSTTF